MRALTIPEAHRVLQIEDDYRQTVVAVIFEDGEVYDHAFNWETAQCMALSGYEVLALDDESRYCSRLPLYSGMRSISPDSSSGR